MRMISANRADRQAMVADGVRHASPCAASGQT